MYVTKHAHAAASKPVTHTRSYQPGHTSGVGGRPSAPKVSAPRASSGGGGHPSAGGAGGKDKKGR